MLGTHQVDAEPKLVGVGPKLVGVESLGRGLHRSVVGTTYVNDRSWHWPTPVSRGSKREALRCCPPSQSPSAVSFQMSAQLLGIERQSWQTQMLGSTSEQQPAASLPGDPSSHVICAKATSRQRDQSQTHECCAALAGRVQRIARPKARLQVDDGVLVVVVVPHSHRLPVDARRVEGGDALVVERP